MRGYKIVVAACCLTASTPLLAQPAPADSSASGSIGWQSEKDDQGNPRLGLLGLLGLAGLLGLFRREPNIHVDARRGPRP